MNKQCELLLTGGVVVTVDDGRRVLDPGAVAIQGDRIVAVGTVDELAVYEATRRIDCKGKMITPGFVDCHNHTAEALVRGVGEGMSLWPWLSTFMLPYMDQNTTEETLAGVNVSAIEAISRGTTCVVDLHEAPVDLETTLAVADAIECAGLRGVVARGMFGPETDVVGRSDPPLKRTFQYSIDDEIAITRAAMGSKCWR